MNIDQQRVRATAAHMVNLHRGSAYLPEERAVDHAFSYDMTDPRHIYWLAVAAAISEISRGQQTND